MVTELSIDDGWKHARDVLVRESGINKFPAFYVSNHIEYAVGNKKEELDGLVLSHDFDGRFLDKTQAKATGELLAKVLREHIAIVTIKPGVSIPG